MNILEDSRSKLVADSRVAQKEKDGKTRYQKRLKSHVSNSTKEFNQINMDNFFKNDILTVSIRVRGETDNYLVKLSWGGVLDSLYNEWKHTQNDHIDLRNIIKALIISFNKNDVYIHCSCPDFKYRFGYWATMNDINSGEPELIPSDETNPNDDLGPACKHSMLVLSNTSWIIKVASVINNYIKYMEQHYENMFANIIYPAIYHKKYEKPTQTSLFDKDDLDTDTEIIDKSNEEGRVRGRFKRSIKPDQEIDVNINDDQIDMFEEE